MKKYILQIISVFLASIMVGISYSFEKVDLSFYRTEGLDLIYFVPNQDDVLLIEIPREYNLFLGKSFVGFKEALGFKESRGDYSSVSQFGYLGKYQFAKHTLKMIGIHDSDSFIEDASLQEKAFQAYTSRNKWILRRDIKHFRGKYIGGVKVTESGILAAAHLSGPENVKKFLRSEGLEGFKDGNGMTIRYYLKKFSGYDTSLIVADKKAKVL